MTRKNHARSYVLNNELIHRPLRTSPINLHVGIYLTKTTLQETVEELIFSGTDMIASVGGYLGLYLGASIMSIYQIGFKLGRRIITKKKCE